MRVALAIVVCKILRFVGKLVGKGSSLPGKYALKLCPDVLGRVKLPPRVIAVTGSNGKTSTVEMIAAILSADGQKVVYNAEGSNQIEGVTTLILSQCSLSGKMRGDVLLLESDERYAKYSFRWFHPTHFVVTNLYRDQLTRNGHPEWVYDAVRAAVFDDTHLVLNADDPLVSCLGRDRENVTWFGVENCPSDEDAPAGVYDDGARCPVCRGKMTYAWRHYHHIGDYSCPACCHRRHTPDHAVTGLDLQKGIMDVDGVEVTLAFRSIYHVYNVLAAWTACALCGVDPAVMKRTVDSYLLKNGRLVTFTLGAHPGTLLTCKHENSIAYDTNLSYIAGLDRNCEVMVIVDAVSRKYFTGETSWLWDVDFGLLNREHVKRVWLCGKYVNDLALRLDFTEIPAERIVCRERISEAAAELKAAGELPLYAATCFSDRDKLLDLTKRD